MRTSVFSPLKNRPFAMLFGGQVVSNVGDWLDFLALNALVAYRWNLGAGALAALTIARMLPLAACGPVAGVWADRLPRRTLMVACDLLRAALVLGLAWAPNLHVVLALVALKAAVSTPFDPAQQGALRALVPENELLRANTLSMLSGQMTKVVAPLLGGMLVAAASPQAAFFADAASFVVSAAFILQLPNITAGAAAGATAGGEARGRFWPEFRGGIKYILSRRLLTLVIACMAAGFFILFMYDTFLALLTKACGIGEAGFGLIVSAVALGSVLGSLATGQWGDRANPLVLMVASVVVTGVLVGAAGLVGIAGLGRTGPLGWPGWLGWLGWLGWAGGNPVLWQAVIWFLVGFSGGAIQVYSGYFLQLETPKELMGRVWSIASTMQNVFPFIGPAAGAVLMGWVGVGGVFVVAGGLYVLMGAAIGIVVRWLGIKVPQAGTAA